MNVVAIMPIKLNNERLPGKNIMMLGKKPLLHYVLESLLAINLIDSINVYCSDDRIIQYLPDNVSFIRRPKFLDLPTSNFTQIFEEFMKAVDADIYVYAHATAPFVSIDTINTCIQAVISGEYDSSFCASKIQDYLWQDGTPLNFDATNIPRSQDLKSVYRETSGVYVFTKHSFEKTHRRVGLHPFIKEVSFKEAVDINNEEDFKLAEILLNSNI